MHTQLSSLLCVLALAAAPAASAQEFDSGSTGVDGALDLSFLSSGDEFVLNPATFDPLLDLDGDNVFHFTTVLIPSGVTVILRGQDYNSAPVYWLASGDVEIHGKLKLSGANGEWVSADNLGMPAEPGPGGYAGGVAGAPGEPLADDDPLRAGQGPGGGIDAATTTANAFLLPLVGGSGGGGCAEGESGGAGGGAILIASSTFFDLSFGTIEAMGGTGCQGGGGGSVRIMAPTIKNNGSKIDVRNGQAGAGTGRIRLESYEISGNVTLWGDARKVTLWPESPLFSPGTEPGVDKPVLKVVSVAGEAVVANPSGDFLDPDVTVDTPPEITVEIEATHVPVGTIVTVLVHSETVGASSFESSPLTGTLESSTATASITIPHGLTRLQLEANW